MFKDYKGKTFCFSPPVMLATFIIEFGFAFYSIWRYKMTTISRLVVAMLFALGSFQLAEYMICGGLGRVNDARHKHTHRRACVRASVQYGRRLSWRLEISPMAGVADGE